MPVRFQRVKGSKQEVAKEATIFVVFGNHLRNLEDLGKSCLLDLVTALQESLNHLL